MQVNADFVKNNWWHAANHWIPYRNGTASLSQLAIEIFSLFIPQTLRPGLAVAIQSAAASAQVTGDINSIVTSALFAETPPAFLTAVPSQYQPNIARVEAALSSIRSGINRVSVSSVDYKNSVSIKSLNGSLQTVNSSILISTTDSRGSGIVTLLPATVVNGTKVEVTPTIRSTSTENVREIRLTGFLVSNHGLADCQCDTTSLIQHKRWFCHSLPGSIRRGRNNWSCGPYCSSLGPAHSIHWIPPHLFGWSDE